MRILHNVLFGSSRSSKVSVPKSKIASSRTSQAQKSMIQKIDSNEIDDEVQEEDSTNQFTGRVHSESYSAQNLSAAFDTIIKSNENLPNDLNQNNFLNQVSLNNSTLNFFQSVQNLTLSTLNSYRQSIIQSLSKEDQSGRIYSKNVRQMKEILSYEKWRKKIQENYLNQLNKINFKNFSNLLNQLIIKNNLTSSQLIRKELFQRPTISDNQITKKLIKEFWKLDKLKDATIIVSYSGYPTLIDELLKLKNIKKVIAIEETPEYCIMYTDRWKDEIEAKRFFHIKNDGYWWESYSEVEEEGLLDDVQVVPWDQDHPSLFFICQLPHNKRSVQFIMQLFSFIPSRNWLFQYGRLGLGFICSGDLCQRITRDQSEKKYTRVTASANCLTSIDTSLDLTQEMTFEKFFPTNLSANSPITSINSNSSKPSKKKVYKSSPAANPAAFATALNVRAAVDLNLSIEEFECMNFLQRVMFIHSAQSWVESISHAAAGASIMYDKLKEQQNHATEPIMIPKTKTPRSFSRQDWINLAKAFSRWPFRPKNFENDLELEADDGSGT